MKVPGVTLTNLFLIVGCGVLSITIAYAVTWFSNYEIGDVSGVIYAVAVAPIIGIIAGVIFTVWRSAGIAAGSTLLGTVVLVIALGLFHWFALQAGWIGGWYKLPTNANFTDRSDRELRSFLSHRNENLREGAWGEFVKRARERPEILVEYVETIRKDSPEDYIDYDETHRAVAVLAEMRAPRAVPYLQEMLASNRATEVTRGELKILRFNSRSLAKQLLEKYYGMKITVPTEQPVP